MRQYKHEHPRNEQDVDAMLELYDDAAELTFMGTTETIVSKHADIMVYLKQHPRSKSADVAEVMGMGTSNVRNYLICLLLDLGSTDGANKNRVLFDNRNVVKTIMQNTISKDTLREYVKRNEVVFQAFGDLVEIANEADKENREELLSCFDKVSSVEVYQKGHWFIKDEFADLNGWATENDVLFLLQNIGVLICVPKRHAIENKLIAA